MTTRSTLMLRRVMGVALAAALAGSGFIASGASAATSTTLEPGPASALQTLSVEEKLAHDAYVVMGTAYDSVLFDNIAESESRHQETVSGLLVKHGIANPTTGDALGVFDDPAVQSRYNDLIARARTSLKSALEVGVLVEESEIRILTGILATTIPRDVRQVATNLVDGERNHLAAFQSALAKVGTTEPSAVGARRVQTAQVRTQASGRYRVGDTLLLAARPVTTDAGVTMRWRVTAESRNVCTVRTENGRTTVTLRTRGSCEVAGSAPAPSPEYSPYRIQRTYRAVG
jgi:hypothetical protein